MKHVIGLTGAVFTAMIFLLAGCPTDSGTTIGIPVGAGSGGAGSTTSSGGFGDAGGSGLPFVGPPDPNAGTSSAGGTATTGAGTGSAPVAVGGVSSDTASADALTVQYSGCENPDQAAFWRSEILRLVNERRLAAGAGAVTRNATLEAQATQYACELIHDDFFAHVNPVTGSTLRERSAEFGYDFWIIGENLAAGQRSPVEAITAWMNSPCHRENILNPAFTELGVGVRIGGDYGVYWVQEFGRPDSVKPYPGPAYEDPECTHAE